MDCPSRGRAGQGNLKIHDSHRNRWRCTTCHRTFSGRKGTPFANLKTDLKIVVLVLTLLAHGCPIQAIVAAFHLDERTVASWQQKAGAHCQAVQQALVQQPRDLGQVQADEIRVRTQGGLLWMAMALQATTRLWLGGVLSAQRDKTLARRLAQLVHSCAQKAALLVVTDGWRAYQDGFYKAFRSPQSTGQRGRPSLVPWQTFVLAQTVKWVESGRTLGIRVCHLFGCHATVGEQVGKGRVLATAYIERLNATFRQHMSALCRRGRCLVASEASLAARMYLVGTVYNFCRAHQSLSEPGSARTPAMAAGITGHIWSMGELLGYHVAPAPYVPPKRRGCPPGKKGASPSKKAGTLLTV